MADLLSPFASSFAQQQAPTPPASGSPPEASRSSSPVRVVGFDSSPTSVVALRRWQSAAVPGTAAALDAAAALVQHGEVGGSKGPAAAAPLSAPPHRQCSLTRQSSLGALLKQQDQLHQLQRRLSINTKSPTGSRRQSPPSAAGAASHPPPPRHRMALPCVAAHVQPVAAIAEDLEQDWMAALTPDSSELHAAAAEVAAAAAVPAPPAPLAGPFSSAQAQPQPPALPAPTQTVPAAGGGAAAMQRACSGNAGGAANAPLLHPAAVTSVMAAMQRQGSSSCLPPGAATAMQRQGSGYPGAVVGGTAMLRQGSASIDIPYHRMRRAETAPALTDDIIAAAAAAAAAGSSAASSRGGVPKGGAGSGSGGGSSGASSYRSSPPSARAPFPPSSSGGGNLRSVPERQASAAREVFEAQAEAVAAQVQAKVLQQALAREQERVQHLQQQLRALMRERAEERALQQQQHQWLHQQQVAAQQFNHPALHGQQQVYRGADPAVPPAPHMQHGPPAPPPAALAPAGVIRPAARPAAVPPLLPAAAPAGLERQEQTNFTELAAALAALGH